MEPEKDPEFARDVLSRNVELYPGVCLSRSLELFKAEFTQVFVATLLVMIASLAVGSVPYFGVFLSGAIHGVLYGGLYAFFLKLIRKQKAEISDAFAGFSPAFPQLLLAGGLASLLAMFAAGLLALPFLLAVIPSIVLLVSDSHSAWPVVPGIFAILGLGAGILAGLTLSTLWVFAVPLVMDKKLDFWPAMELSRKVVSQHFWKMLGLMILCGLVTVSGILLCGIGILFTLPIGFGAIAFAYEEFFGTKA